MQIKDAPIVEYIRNSFSNLVRQRADNKLTFDEFQEYNLALLDLIRLVKQTIQHEYFDTLETCLVLYTTED